MAIALSNAQKIDLIHKHPCFSQLTLEETAQLAALVIEEQIAPGTIIVKENELVDCVYFIASGLAEVRCDISNQDITKATPISILNAGEAIGLSEAGFYSSTGKRTATVIAQSAMILLRLNLLAFHQFAADKPHINNLMRNSADILNRMNLIKEAAPFAKINIDNLHWLAEQVTSFSYSPHSMIFNKGDTGDLCYLITQGEVEIFAPNEDDSETQIAILTPSMVFGETALLMDLSRSASARALQNCDLLAISREPLQHILKKEIDAASSLMTLIKNRIRPKRFSHIETHFLKTNDQKTEIILKDPPLWNYYQLTQEEWFIWQLLDGQHNLHDIALAFNREFKIFNPGMIATFIMDLEESGFIEKCTPQIEDMSSQQSKWIKALLLIRRVMEVSISFGNIDTRITKSYQRWFFIFYTYPAQIIMALITIVGLGAFISQFHDHVELLQNTRNSNWLMFFAIVAVMTSTILHELAHAYTTKAFGRGVACFGVGWFWMGPIAFCDTSDMWLSGRRQRLAVDFAGLYLDLILAGLASLLALAVTSPFLTLFLWLFALMQYVYVFFNLSPNIELDGYYILMDLIGKDNLREEAVMWLANDFGKTWKNPALLRKYRIEILYWVICIIYLILEAVIPYLVMKYLLYGLFGIKNPYISLIIPIVVVILSSLSIWAEFKQKKQVIQQSE